MSIKYEKAYIIAEVAQSHEGSLGLAHSFIDAANKYGANAIKFQIHYAEYESSKGDLFRPGPKFYDNNRYDYWKRLEFNEEAWKGLREHARELGLEFIVSVFSLRALEVAKKIQPDFIKIGSGEVFDTSLLGTLIRNEYPLMISFGMSSMREIEETIRRFSESKEKLVIFQCTSKYPTKLSEVGINVINKLVQQYDNERVSIGLSDHSGSIFPSLAAYANGARYFEVHVTPSKWLFGPDITSSILFDDLVYLRRGLDEFYEMFSSPVDKDLVVNELKEMRSLFTKSIYYNKDLRKDSIILNDDLIFLKPNIGLPISEAPRLVGKKLNKDVSRLMVAQLEDVE
jgi:N,N'-diacetyllegionaminate synthase